MTVNQVKKRTHLIIGQSAFLAVISIGLGYWLLCKVGIEGIGIAYVLAQLSWAVIVFWPLWRELNGKEKKRRSKLREKSVSFSQRYRLLFDWDVCSGTSETGMLGILQ
jgi:Na+-driven multidrug efflux pump